MTNFFAIPSPIAQVRFYFFSSRANLVKGTVRVISLVTGARSLLRHASVLRDMKCCPLDDGFLICMGEDNVCVWKLQESSLSESNSVTYVSLRFFWDGCFFRNFKELDYVPLRFAFCFHLQVGGF
jgi:hypothetical protein